MSHNRNRETLIALGGGDFEEPRQQIQQQKKHWAANQFASSEPIVSSAHIEKALLRGEALQQLNSGSDLQLQADAFVSTRRLYCQRPSRSVFTKPFIRRSKNQMGIVFRDSSKGTQHVLWGRRTVKEGECLGIWDLHGVYHVIEGPRRQWLFNARFRFMDRHVANAHEFLVIQFRDGTKEHRRGPTSLFMDPVRHVSVDVLNAVTVDAYEVIVVYTEDKLTNVQRSVVRGPTVFVPAVNQWLHVFKWHGSVGGDLYSKVPGALVFTKLATIPDQFYYNAEGVRTSDDASLTIKVMVFFALTDLEVMLNSTHDPIADFINALLADLMNFGSAHSWQSFIDAAQHLSDLTSYPVLTSRAAAIGYKISKVVYRGYSTTAALQELCDRAIRTRMELRLKQEEQENVMKLQDMKLTSSVARGAEEREQEATRAAHDLQLKRAEEAAGLENKREAAEQALAQEEAKQKAAQVQQEAAAQGTLRYLQGLKELGVDLTPTILAACEPKPDKVVQLLGIPPGVNVHTHMNA